MALSMDEQRMLAEIERRLAAQDPGLAAKLSSFKGPGPGGRLRSNRSKIIGSLFAVAAAIVISMTVYALVPFRAHNVIGTTNPQATGGVRASAPAKPGVKSAAASAPGQSQSRSAQAKPAQSGAATSARATSGTSAAPVKAPGAP